VVLLREVVDGVVELLAPPAREKGLALVTTTSPDLPRGLGLEGVVAEPVPAPPATASARVGERVLVAEDNPVNQDVTTAMLQRLGYDVDLVPDGRAAIDAVDRFSYAAVLMDCQMPEMDGYQAATEIRRREGTGRRVPIAALTASAAVGDEECCRAAGMDAYITKPISLDVLQAVLNRLLASAAGGPGWAPAPAPAKTVTASRCVDARRAPVDARRLAVLREMGPGGSLLRKMVDAFLDVAAVELAGMGCAVEGGDSECVRQRAHRLRGAAANLGADGVATLCARLERLAAEGQLEGGEALLGALEAELGVAGVALRDAVGAPVP